MSPDITCTLLKGGDDADTRLTENLSRDVGTTLYSAPEQLNCTEHSTKVISPCVYYPVCILILVKETNFYSFLAP